ncbi:response regulator transcription factor [Actinomyces minihominis]|uniref:response regulator transcription factor n=1 Tax=Actinomyces minihominis TaxID=2002838 RepID=UPI000C070A3B|nr:response regulator transcription factor [Actinomyces minihominis]
MPTKPRLLYVEDEDAIAAMVVEVLSEQYLVDHFDNGEEALRAALTRPYEVMVIDRRLPGMEGTELVERLRTAHINTPVLLLTALSTVSDKVAGLDGGANDYLVKPFDFEELLARLRSLRRAFRTTGSRRHIDDWSYVPESRTLFSPYGDRISLTEQENRLLDLLTSNPDHVYSREELLEGAFPGGESKAAVETYVHYIRAKSDRYLIETVRGRGYRVGHPD